MLFFDVLLHAVWVCLMHLGFLDHTVLVNPKLYLIRCGSLGKTIVF